MDALQRFAAHTRHRPASTSLTALARKWLTLHVAPQPETYVHVASDYNLLQARTHSPALSSYGDPARAVDTEAFVWITKNGYPQDRPLTLEEEQQWPALAQFRDTFWPSPVGQEAWEPFQRRDHWKERAYFLATLSDHMRNRAQFHALVDAIYRDGLEANADVDVKDAVSDLYTGLVRYATADAGVRPTVREMGTLLAALNLDHIDKDVCDLGLMAPLVETELETAVDAAASVEEQVPVQNIVLVTSETTPVLDEATLRHHPDVEAFRRRELLPPTFPVRKVLQQMWLCHLGVQVPADLLSAAQRRRDAQPERLEVLPEIAHALLDTVPLAAELDLNAPELQRYYFGRPDGAAGQPISAAALVRGVLQQNGANPELAARVGRAVVNA